jgi:hypothetical protein
MSRNSVLVGTTGMSFHCVFILVALRGAVEFRECLRSRRLLWLSITATKFRIELLADADRGFTEMDRAASTDSLV